MGGGGREEGGVEGIGEWLHINFVVGWSWKYNDVSDSGSSMSW